jgi:PAS domain S-box-containing protein
MKIQSRLYLALGVIIFIIIVILATLVFSARVVNQRVMLSLGAVNLAHHAFLLNSITSDYLLNPGERSAIQWRALFGRTEQLLKKTHFFSKETALIADEIKKSLVKLENVFSEITHEVVVETNPALKDRLRQQTFQLTQDISSKTILLSDKSEESRLAMRANTDRVLFAFIILLGGMVLVGGIRIIRSVARSARELEIAKVKNDAMLASIGDGLIAVDKGGIIITMSEVTEKMLGRDIEGLRGKLLYDVIPLMNEFGKPVPKEKRPMYLALTTGKKTTTTTTTTTTYFYVRSNGDRFPASIVVAPVLLNGKVIGAINNFRDITKEKEIDKAKSEFVSLASHQLKTPPTAISRLTERILSGKVGKLTEKQAEYFNDIRKTNQRMIELVNALLNVSRIELGAFAVKPTRNDVCKVVKNVIEELKPLIASQKLKIQEAYPKDRRETMIDEPLFRMVVHNLVSNSIRYTPKGREIDVACKFVEKLEKVGGKKMKEDSFVVTVADTGCGIPKHQQNKLFTKFFRADNAKEQRTDGTGLGLYIIKSILDHSGGLIWFSSTENNGATFYVSIPASGMRQKEGTKPLVTS